MACQKPKHLEDQLIMNQNAFNFFFKNLNKSVTFDVTHHLRNTVSILYRILMFNAVLQLIL